MVKKKKTSNIVGKLAFLVGFILAIIFGLIGLQKWVIWTLIVLGIIVGLLNITAKEVTPMLIAGTVFVIVSALTISLFPESVKNILAAFLYLFAPATLIVALKSLWSLSKD